MSLVLSRSKFGLQESAVGEAVDKEATGRKFGNQSFATATCKGENIWWLLPSWYVITTHFLRRLIETPQLRKGEGAIRKYKRTNYEGRIVD